MPQFYHLGNLLKLSVRVLKLYLVLITFLSWASTWFPLAVKTSGEYFRQLVTIVVSPLFVFLFSNAIVLFLFFKSGLLLPQYSHKGSNETHTALFIQESVSQALEQEEIMFQDKQTSYEVSSKTDSVEVLEFMKIVTWSGEDQSLGDQDHNSGKELIKRPEMPMEKCRNVEVLAAEDDQCVCMVDELSSEEFKRAIDDFITKQKACIKKREL